MVGSDELNRIVSDPTQTELSVPVIWKQDNQGCDIWLFKNLLNATYLS